MAIAQLNKTHFLYLKNIINNVTHFRLFIATIVDYSAV
jgi:hypothetical protein